MIISYYLYLSARRGEALLLIWENVETWREEEVRGVEGEEDAGCKRGKRTENVGMGGNGKQETKEPREEKF